MQFHNLLTLINTDKINRRACPVLLKFKIYSLYKAYKVWGKNLFLFQTSLTLEELTISLVVPAKPLYQETMAWEVNQFRAATR